MNDHSVYGIQLRVFLTCTHECSSRMGWIHLIVHPNIHVTWIGAGACDEVIAVKAPKLTSILYSLPSPAMLAPLYLASSTTTPNKSPKQSHRSTLHPASQQPNNGLPPLPAPRPSRHNRILTPGLRTTTPNTHQIPPPPLPFHRPTSHGSRCGFHNGLHPLRLQHDVYPRRERERSALPRAGYGW